MDKNHMATELRKGLINAQLPTKLGHGLGHSKRVLHVIYPLVLLTIPGQEKANSLNRGGFPYFVDFPSW